jgi:hypothetical protein
MGRDAICTARFEGRVSEGKVQLETDFLLFRGDFRVRVSFADISTAEVNQGWLRLVWDSESLELDLGPQAETWADRIRSPRLLIDRLGVKPGMRVSVLGVDDERFLDQLSDRTDDATFGEPALGSQMIVMYAGSVAELASLDRLRRFIQRDGSIWVVFPRGRRAIQDVHVIAAAKEAGLVDVKVVRFSETDTAQKLVIPVAQR